MLPLCVVLWELHPMNMMQNTYVRSCLDTCVPLLSSVQCSQTEGWLTEVQLVILNSLFMRFFHLSAINRQRVRLTPLPTARARKTDTAFLNVRQHAEKNHTGCNYNALITHRSRFYYNHILKFPYPV